MTGHSMQAILCDTPIDYFIMPFPTRLVSSSGMKISNGLQS